MKYYDSIKSIATDIGGHVGGGYEKVSTLSLRIGMKWSNDSLNIFKSLIWFADQKGQIIIRQEQWVKNTQTVHRRYLTQHPAPFNI